MLANIFGKVADIVRYLVAIKYLLSLVNEIKELIQFVERPGDGAAKKQEVLNFLRSATTAVEKALQVDVPEELVITFASEIIDLVVLVNNTVGKWRKPDTPALTTG